MLCVHDMCGGRWRSTPPGLTFPNGIADLRTTHCTALAAIRHLVTAPELRRGARRPRAKPPPALAAAGAARAPPMPLGLGMDPQAFPRPCRSTRR